MTIRNTTLCLTIGNRPNELAQTLDSLLEKLPFQHIIAINDFGDEASNTVFRQYCPEGMLIDQGRRIGHHPAVDQMYRHVQTDYIFHCEDDWLFTHTPDLAQAAGLLENPAVSCVVFREISDFFRTEAEQSRIRTIAPSPPSQHKQDSYIRIDHLHEQWYGYTFNPHLAKKSLWQTHGPFAKFKKERHISRYLKNRHGYHAAFLKQGCCHHIGHHSVANPPKTWLQKLLHR